MPPVMVWRALFRHRLSLYVWAVLPSAAPPCGEPADASAALGGEVPLPPAGPVRKGREAPGGNASVLARRQSSNGSASSTPRCRARKLPSWCAAGKRSASTISIEPMRTALVSVTSAPSTATLYETAEPRRSLTAPQSGRPLNCASTLRPDARARYHRCTARRGESAAGT